MIWWPVTFGTISALIARQNTGVYYISALSCHTAPVGHNSVLGKTKSIRPRPKLQDQDRGRSETSLVIRPRSQTPRLQPSMTDTKFCCSCFITKTKWLFSCHNVATCQKYWQFTLEYKRVNNLKAKFWRCSSWTRSLMMGLARAQILS